MHLVSCSQTLYLMLTALHRGKEKSGNVQYNNLFAPPKGVLKLSDCNASGHLPTSMQAVTPAPAEFSTHQMYCDVHYSPQAYWKWSTFWGAFNKSLYYPKPFPFPSVMCYWLVKGSSLFALAIHHGVLSTNCCYILLFLFKLSLYCFLCSSSHSVYGRQDPDPTAILTSQVNEKETHAKTFSTFHKHLMILMHILETVKKKLS